MFPPTPAKFSVIAPPGVLAPTLLLSFFLSLCSLCSCLCDLCVTVPLSSSADSKGAVRPDSLFYAKLWRDSQPRHPDRSNGAFCRCRARFVRPGRFAGAEGPRHKLRVLALVPLFDFRFSICGFCFLIADNLLFSVSALSLLLFLNLKLNTENCAPALTPPRNAAPISPTAGTAPAPSPDPPPKSPARKSPCPSLSG